MLRHIPNTKLFLSNSVPWLESRFHFSFAEYCNPINVEFGVLRVLNDDLVQPRNGFGTHSHRDMEICTYVVDGYLTHKDSMGTSETLGRGSVQYMSAGSGVNHSEMNNANELLRFIQIWIKPNRKGLSPNYGSRVFKKENRHNTLQHIVTSFSNYGESEDSGSGVIPIHQDTNIYVSEVDAGFKQEFVLQKNRQAYLVCIEGGLHINKEVELVRCDAIEMSTKQNNFAVELKADDSNGAHFIMIEMPVSK